MEAFGGQALLHGLIDEEWDIITLQHGDGNSGIPGSFGTLSNILDYVQSHALNPDVKIYWHATWAYQQGSSNPSFSKYNYDQMTMYQCIADTSRGLDDERICGIVPSCTSIQNARTSSLGDHLTRDGYHLSIPVGRYIAGLTYAATLLGVSPYTINWAPDGVLPETVAIAQEAVSNAIAKPFEVTQAQ